jgi:hypothetical protein
LSLLAESGLLIRSAGDSALIAASATAMLSGCAGTTDGSGFLLFI